MFLQQGDVLLTKVAKDKISKTAKRVAPVRGRLILAEGEATGHAHAVTTEEGIKLYTMDQILFLTADHDCTVVHEEHGPVTIPKGTWQVGAVQEYDYVEQEARNVRD
jgi:DNA-binding LytR/AlgR family response regulator|tara:strand:+ start:295 stop:615 length:321 start_codon:yes stop_codon:yes gene_type:complete